MPMLTVIGGCGRSGWRLAAAVFREWPARRESAAAA
jgi:hypothetical protein